MRGSTGLLVLTAVREMSGGSEKDVFGQQCELPGADGALHHLRQRAILKLPGAGSRIQLLVSDQRYLEAKSIDFFPWPLRRRPAEPFDGLQADVVRPVLQFNLHTA